MNSACKMIGNNPPPPLVARSTPQLHVMFGEGVLCREFLSAHLHPSTPVIMSGSGADDVSLAVGGLLYEELDNLSLLTPGQTASKSRDHPAGGGSDDLPNNPSMVCVEETTNEARVNSTCDCRGGAKASAPSDTTAVAQLSGGSVGSGGSATVKGEAGPVAGENGGVDVCTVGELYPWRNFYGVTGRGEQLRLGFLRQQVIGRSSPPGVISCSPVCLQREAMPAYRVYVPA